MADVVVIGGANIDIKAKPERGALDATSNPGSVTISLGGVARNIAHNLAALGVSTELVTGIGTDAFGDMIMDSCKELGIGTSAIKRWKNQSDIYVAQLDAQGELVSAVNDMPNVGGIRDDQLFEAIFMANDAKLVVADCNVPAQSLDMLAEVLGDILLVEPVSDHKALKLERLMNKVAYATPNISQLKVLSKKKGAEAACRELQREKIGQVIVNAGPSGASYLHEDQFKIMPPHLHDKIVDVTGAGDASVAGLVYGLVRKLPLPECVRLGQMAAGVVASSYASALDREQAKVVKEWAALA